MDVLNVIGEDYRTIYNIFKDSATELLRRFYNLEGQYVNIESYCFVMAKNSCCEIEIIKISELIESDESVKYYKEECNIYPLSIFYKYDDSILYTVNDSIDKVFMDDFNDNVQTGYDFYYFIK